MIEIRGKYNTAKVFTDNVEQEAIAQIMELCNQEFVKDSIIRIMPDTHAGAGCTIGTTMTINDKIVPNLVGVDIGCGMETIKLKNKNIELSKLDKIIHEYIPSGFDIRKKEHPYVTNIDFEGLACRKNVNINRAKLSVGTLGGGNHFIEVNKDNEGNLYLVVHSGSRHLGKQVAEYYQDLGYRELVNNSEEVKAIIERLKAEGRQKEIEKEIKKVKPPKINKQLAYVQGKSYEDYLADMKLVQKFAVLNRKAIVDEIVRRMDFKIEEQFTTIHNYIDMDSMILRKGAISARQGEKVLIPINMRDGSLICIGKGNKDWNYSAPHGAGRLMSRSKAKEVITLKEFEASMEGIYSTTVNRSTLDECPMAYKPMEEIIENIRDTVEITDTIKPIYNFKAAE
ncbi:RtcB family protein [Acetivibrio mesophilus]|uniref:3'-phosphate/5'-hydroxy nucleic acid ligase n=1 Tax=Acetivibrio mesophilus TaxID=2487273 RepID=A0A4Q0I5B1_9FIRM|nr:RtcB family protein [Acetivibrio mesophilus]ODM25902.1 RNA-splicing ligase RtcB [Clostridium sp. Bc-iso-3]RXE59513.1 RNA-splicing ligase RtcB [Acetivibrio mesophilus]HHV29989.1 RtcB family protein [Clostridium sp.]